MRFYCGLHQPSDARHFDRCMVSVARLWNRRSDFDVREWMMDSGAFTEVAKHGGYRHTAAEYAAKIARWCRCGQLVAAVSQDFMCEAFVLARTGGTVESHQRQTIERFVAILREMERLEVGTYLLPVLQGFRPAEYVAHVEMYGDLLPAGAWVGVGSVCKRNGDPSQIEDVILAIHSARPDLRLHGFGLKLTALRSDVVRSRLFSADSLAWSFSARKQGRGGNDWREGMAYVERVRTQPRPAQASLFAREVA